MAFRNSGFPLNGNTEVDVGGPRGTIEVLGFLCGPLFFIL